MSRGEAYVAPSGVFRLLADWPNAAPSAPKAGALVARDTRLHDRIWSRIDGRGGFQAKPDQLEIEPHPVLDWRDFPVMLDYYLSGHGRLPNLKPLPTEAGLRNIACCAGWTTRPGIATVRIPGDNSNWGTWARVFLSFTQGGMIDGSGCLIAYQRQHQRYEHGPVYSFALCEHRKQTGAGARPMYGWHPGRCIRCGLDMTVDSSD